MKMLIVDDEHTAIRDLEIVLKKVDPDAEIFSADNYKDALRLCKEEAPDVAFLDVSMPGKDGISLAKEINKLSKDINVIMVTAYKEYALDAFKVFASGYIIKPAMVKEIRKTLNNLRYPVAGKRDKGLFIQCFGNFEVYYDGENVKFARSKAKELLAYLVDRQGASATNAEIRAALWSEEDIDDLSQRNYFTQITRELRITLEKIGCENILSWDHNSYSIIPEKIECDYYLALKGDEKAIAHFENEYMKQYPWADGKAEVLSTKLIGSLSV